MLYRVIDEHLETFLDAAAQHADGHRLPKFVEQEFRDFLTCGVLAHGFARLRCGDCAFERLVPFSCKGRGFCPSCGGRRMTEGAARLVDGILPHVPVRQWVLSLPHRLRYLIAWDHELCRAVLNVRVCRLLLRRQGFDATAADLSRPDPIAEESPMLAGISSASIQGRIALGPRAGRRVWQVGEEPDAPWVPSSQPRHAHLLRPLVAQERLRRMGDDRILLTLKTPWADGTRHLLFGADGAPREARRPDPAPADQPDPLSRCARAARAMARPGGGLRRSPRNRRDSSESRE